MMPTDQQTVINLALLAKVALNCYTITNVALGNSCNVHNSHNIYHVTVLTHVPRRPCTQFHNIVPDSIDFLLFFLRPACNLGLLAEVVPMRVSTTTLGFAAAMALLNAPRQMQ